MYVCVFLGECCQEMCTMEYEPICGTDGVTYGNLCELTSQACLKKNNAQVAYAGKYCEIIGQLPL